jgi:hypothetical protein
LGQVHGGLDAHRFQVRFYALADARHFTDVSVPERPVALEGVADVDHPARFVEEALGGVVREFGEGFGSGDADTHGNACSLVDGGADLAAEDGQVAGYAGQVGEGFVM